MANISVQELGASGDAVTFQAADGAGDSFTNNGREYLHVKNGSGSVMTVTIDSQKPCNYGVDHDVQKDVAAGETQVFGPFPTPRFNDINNKVQVAYSDATSVEVAATR